MRQRPRMWQSADDQEADYLGLSTACISPGCEQALMRLRDLQAERAMMRRAFVTSLLMTAVPEVLDRHRFE